MSFVTSEHEIFIELLAYLMATDAPVPITKVGTTTVIIGKHNRLIGHENRDPSVIVLSPVRGMLLRYLSRSSKRIELLWTFADRRDFTSE